MSKARELSKLPNYVLSTVAELKLAVGKEQGDKAFVGGYYADGDGGGGDFYWDAVSVEADNGGTIFQVTGTTTGRWKRIYSGSVNIKWFGITFTAPEVSKLDFYNNASIVSVPQPEKLTLIQPNLKSISATDSIVITGDSLSLNGFGYNSGLYPNVNGAGYATANPVALQSWAHLTRDFLINSSRAFVPIRDTVIVSTAIPSSPELALPYSQNVAMGFEANIYTFNTLSDKVNIDYKKPGNYNLLVGYGDSSDAVNFTINGQVKNNLSPDGKFLSHGYFIVPFINYNSCIEIKNVSKISDGTAGSLTIYGLIVIDQKIPALTGKGAWTSGQILAEYSTLVQPYNPDIIMYIIGANDTSNTNGYFDYYENVNLFIDTALAQNPNVRIVLIGMPPSSSYTKTHARRYTIAGRKIAEDRKCSFIDLYSELELFSPTLYRYDNIHFTANGDNIVFNIMKNILFQNLKSKTSYVPERGFFSGWNTSKVSIPLESIRFMYVLATTTPTFYSDSLRAGMEADVRVTYATTANGKTGFKIDAPYGYEVANCRILNLDTPVEFIVYNSDPEYGSSYYYIVDSAMTVIDPNGSGLYISFTITRDYTFTA